MIGHFPNVKLFLYGGFLRDRLAESVHGKQVKVMDYDFMIDEDYIDSFKEYLETYNFEEI